MKIGKYIPWLAVGVGIWWFMNRKQSVTGAINAAEASADSAIDSMSGMAGLGHCPTRITPTGGITRSPQGGARSADSQGSSLSVKPQGSYGISHRTSVSQCCLTPGLRLPGGLGVYGG